MERDTSFYTRLTCERKCVEDFGPKKVTVEETVWDLDGPGYFDMFKTIMIGLGFSEETIRHSAITWLEDTYDMELVDRKEEEGDDK